MSTSRACLRPLVVAFHNFISNWPFDAVALDIQHTDAPADDRGQLRSLTGFDRSGAGVMIVDSTLPRSISRATTAMGLGR